ncbi:MAG: conjugal transfer protein TraF [Novosphingobium sp.]
MKRLAIVMTGAMAALPAPVDAQPLAPAGEVREARGYWWYDLPRPAGPPQKDAQFPDKPVIPPMNELASWTPPRIARLIEQQRDYAATVLTIDAVADFWRLEDFARRKARAFAGVTQLAMLTYPELNAKAANPMVGEARDALTANKEQVRRQYLRSKAGEFALVMFARASCGYCKVQWPIVQRFQDEMGWQVSLMDLDRRPELGQRFGVEITPTTMVIRRSSPQRMVIAAGVETYPNLSQMVYQAVRLLSSDIRPEQWLTAAGEENGFFDALANGPVSASDPRAASPERTTPAGERP